MALSHKEGTEPNFIARLLGKKSIDAHWVIKLEFIDPENDFSIYTCSHKDYDIIKKEYEHLLSQIEQQKEIQ